MPVRCPISHSSATLLLVFSLGASIHAQTTPTYNDVVYGTGALDGGGSIPLRMDIYKPTGVNTPTPVLVWIHGGGWIGGSHDTPPGLALPLLQRGISVVSVEYRLSGEAIFPAQIHDVKGAVRFLRANASTYGIDPLRLGAWGTSAGGHLTALLATSGGVASAEGVVGGNIGQSTRILAAVDYFGPTDLLNMQLDVTTPPGSNIDHDAYTSPESQLIGFDNPGQGIGVLRANQDNPAAPFPQKIALATLANPITHVSLDDPIMYIAHGLSDATVPNKQSQRLYDALLAAGVSASYTPVPGAGHGNLGTATNNAALNFLETELKRTFGDANRDGRVDIADLGSLASNWQQSGGWAQGDFNSSGFVDVQDLGMLALYWQSGVASGAQSSLNEAVAAFGLPTTGVPEPIGLNLALLSVTFLLRRSF
jgi:acetyl esterase/lipase